LVEILLSYLFLGRLEIKNDVVIGLVQLVIHFRKFNCLIYFWMILAKLRYYSNKFRSINFSENINHMTDFSTLNTLCFFVRIFSWDFVFFCFLLIFGLLSLIHNMLLLCSFFLEESLYPVGLKWRKIRLLIFPLDSF
jgi:hypothetical protein